MLANKNGRLHSLYSPLNLTAGDHMSAIPEESVHATTGLSTQGLAAAAVSAEVTRALSGAHRICGRGSRKDMRVPMREIRQADTPASFGAQHNPPLTVYDTSGPYTDPDVAIDLLAGLPAPRATWIAERDDTHTLSGPSSSYGRARQVIPNSNTCVSSISISPGAASRAPTLRRCTTRVTVWSQRRWNSSPSAKTAGLRNCARLTSAPVICGSIAAIASARRFPMP